MPPCLKALHQYFDDTPLFKTLFAFSIVPSILPDERSAHLFRKNLEKVLHGDQQHSEIKKAGQLLQATRL